MKPTEKPADVRALGWLIGLFPALAAADSATHGLLIAVLALLTAGLTLAVLSRVERGNRIPDAVRIPLLLAFAAFFAGLISVLSNAYLPSSYDGIRPYFPLLALYALFVPLAFPGLTDQSSHASWGKLAAGIIVLPTLCGLFRELLGAGTLFGVSVLPEWAEPLTVFHSVPGAFLTAALILMGTNALGITPESGDGEEGVK